LALSLAVIPLSLALGNIRMDYTLVTVAAGGAVLGIVCGVLGSFAVLRQQSLLGDALSHAALPGVALAFLLAGRELGWLLLGAGIASWLGVLLINSLVRRTRLKQDAAMGVVLTAFFALGITLLTYIQSRNDASQAGLDQFIFGQAAAIRRQDVVLISAVGLAAFLVLIALWKEFKLITFDPAFAQANGFPLRLLDVTLSTLIVIAIVLGLQLAGVVLMVGLLIAPAVAARQWTRQLDQMLVLAGIFGGLAGAGGAIFSGLQQGLPTGPLIIVVAVAIVALSISLAPERGLLWRAWRQRRDIHTAPGVVATATSAQAFAFAAGESGEACRHFLVGLGPRGRIRAQGEGQPGERAHPHERASRDLARLRLPCLLYPLRCHPIPTPAPGCLRACADPTARSDPGRARGRPYR